MTYKPMLSTRFPAELKSFLQNVLTPVGLYAEGWRPLEGMILKVLRAMLNATTGRELYTLFDPETIDVYSPEKTFLGILPVEDGYLLGAFMHVAVVEGNIVFTVYDSNPETDIIGDALPGFAAMKKESEYVQSNDLAEFLTLRMERMCEATIVTDDGERCAPLWGSGWFPTVTLIKDQVGHRLEYRFTSNVTG